MNLIKYALITFLLSACSGTESNPNDDPNDDMDLSSVEEAVTAQCASPNLFGVDAGSGTMRRCNINNASNGCHFPGDAFGNFVFSSPFGIGLTTGWAATEKSELSAAFSQSSTFINNTFQSCLTAGGQQQATFKVNLTSNGQERVTIKKGTLPGTLGASNTAEQWYKMLSLNCTESHPFTEPYPASVRGCTRWEAVIDYAKIKAWNASGRFQTVKNLTKRIYAQTMGLGYNSNLFASDSVYVLSEFPSRNIDSTLWEGNEVSWVCNYLRHPVDTDPSFFVCD